MKEILCTNKRDKAQSDERFLLHLAASKEQITSAKENSLYPELESCFILLKFTIERMQKHVVEKIICSQCGNPCVVEDLEAISVRCSFCVNANQKMEEK